MIMNRFAVFSEFDLAYCSVILRICAIHVTCKSSAQKTVVQSGIELYSAIFASAFHFDSGKML